VNVNNIILMGIAASNFRDLIHLQRVSHPLEYGSQVLDKNHTGFLSIQHIAEDPVLRGLLVSISDLLTFIRSNNTEVISNALVNTFANNTIGAGYIDIDRQLKPLLIKRYENLTSFNLSNITWLKHALNITGHYSA
jgi:hypothetical protein